jgi:hypothetical protein
MLYMEHRWLVMRLNFSEDGYLEYEEFFLPKPFIYAVIFISNRQDRQLFSFSFFNLIILN